MWSLEYQRVFSSNNPQSSILASEELFIFFWQQTMCEKIWCFCCAEYRATQRIRCWHTIWVNKDMKICEKLWKGTVWLISLTVMPALNRWSSLPCQEWSKKWVFLSLAEPMWTVLRGWKPAMLVFLNGMKFLSPFLKSYLWYGSKYKKHWMYGHWHG